MPIKKKKNIEEVENPPVFNDSFEDVPSEEMADCIGNPPNESESKDNTENTEDSEEGLTIKQIRFCHYYVKIKETRGNNTLSYAMAYDLDLDNLSKIRELDGEGKEIIGTSEYDKKYHYASVGGARMMRKDSINEYIRKLWLEMMNDDVMDARLTEIAVGSKDEVSLRAVQEYNKMKGRILDRTKDESDSDKAKAELFTEVKEKIKTMDSRELIDSIQELLTKK